MQKYFFSRLLLAVCCVWFGFSCPAVKTLAAEVVLDLDKPGSSSLAYHTWGAPGLDFNIYYTEEYVRENQSKFKSVTPETVAGKDSDIYVKLVLDKARDLVVRLAKNTSAGTSMSCDLLPADRKTVITHQTLTWKYGNYWEKDALTGNLPAGTYYLHLYDFIEGSCMGAYGTFTIFAPCANTATDDDASGPNDVKEQAVKLTPGVNTFGFLSYLGDDPADWYTFEVTEAEASFRADLNTEWYYTGFESRLYRSEGGQLVPVSMELGEPVSLAKGTYYVCLSFTTNEPSDGYVRRGNSYYLRLTQKEPETTKAEPETTKAAPETTKAEPETTKAEQDIQTYIPKKGDTFTAGSLTYKVTKVTASGGSVSVKGIVDKKQSSVKIPASVTFHGRKFSVTAIAAGAFSGCSMEKVTIGSKIVRIEKNAFYKAAKLKSVVIPASVTSIGAKAFYGCKALKTVTFKTKKLTSARVGSQAFKRTYSKATVKVPKAVKKLYKAFLLKKGFGTKVKFQ